MSFHDIAGVGVPEEGISNSFGEDSINVRLRATESWTGQRIVFRKQSTADRLPQSLGRRVVGPATFSVSGRGNLIPSDTSGMTLGDERNRWNSYSEVVDASKKLLLPDYAANPDAVIGSLYYNNVSKLLRWSDGTSWFELVSLGVANNWTALQTFSGGLVLESRASDPAWVQGRVWLDTTANRIRYGATGSVFRSVARLDANTFTGVQDFTAVLQMLLPNASDSSASAIYTVGDVHTYRGSVSATAFTVAALERAQTFTGAMTMNAAWTMVTGNTATFNSGSTLDLNGALLLPDASGNPSASAGKFYHNSGTNRVRSSDGASWFEYAVVDAAQTFTALQTFSAGITASAGTVSTTAAVFTIKHYSVGAALSAANWPLTTGNQIATVHDGTTFWIAVQEASNKWAVALTLIT